MPRLGHTTSASFEEWEGAHGFDVLRCGHARHPEEIIISTLLRPNHDVAVLKVKVRNKISSLWSLHVQCPAPKNSDV